MMETVGGSSSGSTADLVEQYEPLAHHLVADAMRRVPPSVTTEELTSSALTALAEAARLYEPESHGEFAGFARPRMQAALVRTLHLIDWTARGSRSRVPASPDRVHAVQAAVAALPGDRRAVIEGYFLHERPMHLLAAELELDSEDLVDLRTDALRALGRTLAPVLAATGQERSSLGSSGTGSPRISNLR